jgi:glucose-1-phosphate thymidylyltransferase
MKIIVPMAGMGKRMRPHTLTVPKPLIPIAGKPIVQRLVEEIAIVANDKIEEIAFIIGDFGKEIEKKLISIAENLGAKGSIYYQHEALGTAHAIYCAEKSLKGKTIVAFADTLFKADFKITDDIEAGIWVQKIDDPSAFGVVKIDSNKIITDFVEKPKDFVSDLAIIGIYYFKDADILRKELKQLLDNKVMVNGEYQLTDALENMKNAGIKFSANEIKEWMDCGNKDATVYTNQRTLEHLKDSKLIDDSAQLVNSIIIPPCFIGKNVVIHDSIIGPHVSIEENTQINKVIISNSIVQTNSSLANISLINSMIGNYAIMQDVTVETSVGDYTNITINQKSN